MTKVIGFHKNNTMVCNNCGAIIEYYNDDIIRDDMGLCIVCPNCNKDIKF